MPNPTIWKCTNCLNNTHETSSCRAEVCKNPLCIGKPIHKLGKDCMWYPICLDCNQGGHAARICRQDFIQSKNNTIVAVKATPKA